MAENEWEKNEDREEEETETMSNPTPDDRIEDNNSVVVNSKMHQYHQRFSITLTRDVYLPVCIAGCGDTAAVLTGSCGYYHFNEVPIDNRMECGWNIRGYDNQVTNLRNTLLKYYI